MGSDVSRRGVLAVAAGLLRAEAKRRKIPVGLELYSVRDRLKEDTLGTVREVARMGYEGVEFYSPYYEWTAGYAKEVRKVLDDSGLKCFSTHNSSGYLAPDQLPKAIELNQILGSRYVVMASAGKPPDLDGWKRVADRLNEAAAKLRPLGMRTGFHNHQTEFQPLGGVRPMDVLAKNTDRDVVLQLDVGTCLEAGSDPVKWVKQNPGRIVSMHCKDWKKGERGYRVLFGEGDAPWKQLFKAAEKTGGLEYYLIEQESSDFPSLETARRCLETFRKVHG